MNSSKYSVLFQIYQIAYYCYITFTMFHENNTIISKNFLKDLRTKKLKLQKMVRIK